MHTTVRRRVWLSFAVVITAIGVTTVVIPRWLEIVFGVDPDAGSGAAELLIVIVALASSALCWARVAASVRAAG